MGVKEALKVNPFDCFIFHDVDMVPLNDKNIYYCDDNLRHFPSALNEIPPRQVTKYIICPYAIRKSFHATLSKWFIIEKRSNFKDVFFNVLIYVQLCRFPVIIVSIL